MSKEKLIKEIIQLQGKADKSRRRYELDIWMSLPLTMAQLKSLFFIDDERITTPGKLASVLRVTPTDITGIIDRLVRQGLVSRTGDVRDRRFISLRVTDKGEKLITGLRSRRTGYLREILSLMTAEELSKMAQGLAAFIEAAEAHDTEIPFESIAGDKDRGLYREKDPSVP